MPNYLLEYVAIISRDRYIVYDMAEKKKAIFWEYWPNTSLGSLGQ